MIMMQRSSMNMGTCKKILSTIHISKQRKISPTRTTAQDQQGEEQHTSTKSIITESIQTSLHKRRSSIQSNKSIDVDRPDSEPRRASVKCSKDTKTKWYHCRWSMVDQEYNDTDADAADGDSLYHILDDSWGSRGTDVAQDECCLDISDSKRLSLMDVLLKDELSSSFLEKR